MRSSGTPSGSVDSHQSTYQKLAIAQTKAWRQAAGKLRVLSRKVAPARRKDLAAALKQLKADASNAQARLKRLESAGATTWSAMRTALNVSRKEFDRASRQAATAIRRAMK